MFFTDLSGIFHVSSVQAHRWNFRIADASWFGPQQSWPVKALFTSWAKIEKQNLLTSAMPQPKVGYCSNAQLLQFKRFTQIYTAKS